MDYLKIAAEHSAWGIAVYVLVKALVAIYAHGRKDRTAFDKKFKDKDTQLTTLQERLSEEQELRVQDAQRFTEVALELQGEVISSVSSIDNASGEHAKLCKVVGQLVDAVEDVLERGNGGALRRR